MTATCATTRRNSTRLTSVVSKVGEGIIVIYDGPLVHLYRDDLKYGNGGS